ncbi:MAG: DNA repair protein RecO [Verrucomicrobiota bacterium]
MPKDNAILLRRYQLTETSLIVHWCAADSGIIKTIAKGAQRPKSPFVGKLDLFFDAEIEFFRSRKSDLHTLQDLEVTNPRMNLRTSYPRTLAASYFIQLVEIVSERDTPLTELHSLLQRALNYLNDNEPNLKAITHFERELARAVGIDQSGTSPINTIADTFHRLPESRDDLLGTLNTKPS